ncbi:unnamed protein product [Rhizoctonia solani]|uniref:Uncharacterized protein n=1 Tax=Rhizoctonia solani TaxID=456999 RepID=A0A8H3AQU1_9AGAM|nr:unnamed protein product [Rhizoctonia solani]
MADVEERPGRQLATNLRELMKQVDIRTGTDRDTNVNMEERDNESVASASVRDIFARARTNIPTPGSRITRPRGLSIDSDVLSTNDGDDASTVEDTPIARVPPTAAALHALRQRLETASDASDLTGWDRSARSLLTTRGQASQSRLNVYDDGSNLLDEDLDQVPALTVSHVDFAPSVSNSSQTTSVGTTPRQRPPVIPRGPSLQSASIADRLAGIPDDGLDFDDTDREDFDRNVTGDDSDDLLHQENDLLRSSSPPPPDSPMKPQVRPISGSWENVMPEGSVMSLPNVDGRRPEQRQELGSSGGSGESSGSRLMQAIQDEEDSYQRRQDKSGSTVVGDETQRPSTSPDKANRPTSRLSTSSRSRLPLAKASTSSTPKSTPTSSSKPAPMPSKPAPASTKSTPVADRPGHRATRSDVAFPSSQDGPTRPVGRLAPETSRIPRPTSPGPGAHPASRLDGPQSPASPRTSIIPPVTPSRIPRVSMSNSPRSSIDGSPSHMVRSVSAATPSRTRATSALGTHPPVTPSRTRATSAMASNGTPPKTDVDREQEWGKHLPQLTHANLRMKHDQMDTVQSYLSGMSPEGKSVAGRSRPTTPSFVGYSRKGTSEVSSSQGSAGSDEDTELRRSRKLSLASAKGTKSGWELRGSPPAPSVTRSPGIVRTTSLKTPSKAGAATMRHSLSFTGSPSTTGSDRGMSPLNSPRKLSNRGSTEFVSPKEYKALRERDWGRPAGSRALSITHVRTRGGTPGAARKRVVSGGSLAGSDAGLTSPVRERTGSAKARPHTVHMGGSYMSAGAPSLEQLGREPLDGGFEDDEMSESVLEWQRRQQSIEDLQEETEVEMEITRPESPSPPSPSRSIPLPDSPPPPTRPLQRGTTPPRPLSRNHSVPKVQLHPPQEPSVSLFGNGMVGESTTLESSRGRRDSLRRDSTIRGERETTVREERRDSTRDERRESTREEYASQEEEHPDSPTHLTFAQPDSPTISFMDTLPPLPEPPSDDEHSVVVQPVRPSVNTRLNRIAREPSPGSGSGSEKTPRASTMSLRVPSPRVPTPPEPETAKEAPTTSWLGLEPSPVQADKLEVPRPIRTRSRSNTLGTSLPRVDVNAFAQRDEIDSAATPIATRWNPPAREEKKPVEVKAPRKISPLASQASSPAIQNSTPLPSTSSAVPPALQARHSDPQLPPMMSQKGKEILQRMQLQAATLARDLKVESQQAIPQGDETKPETDQIVQLSVTARAERERLEKLRQARGPKEQIRVVEVPVRRRSISWILFSILVSALCIWLALYALSHHATNVYLDPLYPVLYGGDNNPLRSARSIDTFPTAWHMYLVPKSGIEHWLTPITQKLWALPTNWRPS